jgi:ribosome-binding protein aMBF1 (putative translation factor)
MLRQRGNQRAEHGQRENPGGGGGSHLGKRVRELRHERGFSQEKLAELANIHENHVRRIEGGTANPSYLVVAPVVGQFEIIL